MTLSPVGVRLKSLPTGGAAIPPPEAKDSSLAYWRIPPCNCVPLVHHEQLAKLQQLMDKAESEVAASVVRINATDSRLAGLGRTVRELVVAVDRGAKAGNRQVVEDFLAGKQAASERSAESRCAFQAQAARI